jgi:hypothetical protein
MEPDKRMNLSTWASRLCHGIGWLSGDMMVRAQFGNRIHELLDETPTRDEARALMEFFKEQDILPAVYKEVKINAPFQRGWTKLRQIAAEWEK